MYPSINFNPVLSLTLNLNKMKVAILGYGKMGQIIEKIALERGHNILLKINLSNIDELNIENLKKVDVVIDFSTPESAKQTLYFQ